LVHSNVLISFYLFKDEVRRKIGWVMSDINRQLLLYCLGAFQRDTIL
jgi:hypothetical protein